MCYIYIYIYTIVLYYNDIDMALPRRQVATRHPGAGPREADAMAFLAHGAGGEVFGGLRPGLGHVRFDVLKLDPR